MPVTPTIPPTREAVLVARWGAGALAGRWLRTAAGEELAVLFPGRPGGPAGPDFRDAVLLRRDGARVCGDVEVHTRARGWHAHGHDRDPRYDGVVLHVVAHAEGARATPLPSGGWAPVLELDAGERAIQGNPGDEGNQGNQGNQRTWGDSVCPALPRASAAPAWPCHDLAERVGRMGMRALLAAAGDARFEAHARRLGERIVAYEAGAEPAGKPASSLVGPLPWAAADRVLFAALAEGLAYGRDREPLRQAGEWLAAGGAPDALTRELPRLPALDGVRLEGLLALYARWEADGPWAALGGILAADGALAAISRALVDAIGVPGGAVSPGRAAILLANVVLPFAAAWAARTGDADLGARARAVYAALGGLPSNQITRAMGRQLGLRCQPPGARAQQGLHHIWATWCREKRCASCPCAESAAVASGRIICSAVC